MNDASIFAFFLVFVRASAMLISAPVFGAQNTPVTVRVLTTLSIAAALSSVVQPTIGPIPSNMMHMAMVVGHEAAAGLLIGVFTTLALQALTIAGGLMDLQTGLSMSQTLNPVSGVSASVMAQFKFMLGVVTFLAIDAHQLLIKAFVASYQANPNFEVSAKAFLAMVATSFSLGLQVAAPVVACGLLVDAALGLLNRAVPQLQAMQVGAPVKIGVGLVVIGFGLPIVASAASHGVEISFRALELIFRKA